MSSLKTYSFYSPALNKIHNRDGNDTEVTIRKTSMKLSFNWQLGQISHCAWQISELQFLKHCERSSQVKPSGYPIILSKQLAQPLDDKASQQILPHKEAYWMDVEMAIHLPLRLSPAIFKEEGEYRPYQASVICWMFWWTPTGRFRDVYGLNLIHVERGNHVVTSSVVAGSTSSLHT